MRNGQLNTVLSTIRRANDQAKASSGHADPIVIVFVHGWKNNAAPGNGNVAGFKVALQRVYQHYKTTHRVVEIYIGWRGDLIKKEWPVTRQLSYYNREATAARVPGAELGSMLTQIATRTHENPGSMAIFIGHSFGGLLLERAVSEAMASEIAQANIYEQEARTAPSGSKEATMDVLLAQAAAAARADLVIYINTAGAATESKQMLDFLIRGGYRYTPAIQSGATNLSPALLDRDADRPLLVSLTSTADLATKLAVPIGHSLPDLRFKMAGSFRKLSAAPGDYGLACFDPHRDPLYWELTTRAQGALSQSSYYMNTAPHMPILQSHVMLKAVSAKEMQVSSTGEKIHIHNPRAIAECNRELFNEEHLGIVSAFRLADTQVCFAIQERPNRCNGSPYWMMEIDPDVVPDHSTIFTGRSIQFLIDTFFTTPQGRPLGRDHPQMVATR